MLATARTQLARLPASQAAVRHLSLASVPNPLPVSFLRGGTSKGIFIRRDLLPDDEASWAPVFLGLMGSPDPEYGRQLDGMGGGVSSLSKIVVVGLASAGRGLNGGRDGISRGRDEDTGMGTDVEADVAYTFCQVGIRDARLDYSGNCGNLSSMVGVFAVDEAMCTPRINDSASAAALSTMGEDKGKLITGTVRSWNTNTRKRVDTTFPLAFTPSSGAGARLDLPQARISGVPGRASRIDLDFVKPAGAGTTSGVLLPTGRAVDELAFKTNSTGTEHCIIRASLVDATNPTVFIAASDLSRVLLPLHHSNVPAAATAAAAELGIAYGTVSVDACVEQIRQAGARAMGFHDPLPEAQPKIAILSTLPHPAPGVDADTADGVVSEKDAETTHIVAQAYSMRVPHRAIPMTVGLCLGVAACTPGTLAWDIVQRRRRLHESRPSSGSADPGFVRIRHPSGDVEVGAEFDEHGQIKSAKVLRTGKRLMRGVVWW